MGQENGRFSFIEAISSQGSQHMGHGIDGASVAGMLQVKDRSENIIDRFNNCSFSELQLIFKKQQLVFHVGSDFGDELQALPVKLLKEGCHVAFVCKALAFQAFEQVPEHSLIIVSHVTWGEDKVDDFPLLVDDQVNFEAIEPAHGTFPPACLCAEDFVAVNSSVMAHRQRFGVYDIPATVPGKKRSPLEEDVQTRQQPGYQGHEPLIADQVREVAPKTSAYLLLVVVLKTLVAGKLVENQDTEHLTVMHHRAVGNTTLELWLMALPLFKSHTEIIQADKQLYQLIFFIFAKHGLLEFK